ncbi:helix-turn-helix transcriptional regulator [Neobacillus sp. MM2021_6]|uniref:helix-turn-helix domain-containing protein n=1 Tax=Bacillaceae TaxID=186817 RepID=UPI00140C9658|nr:MULTISPECIES: helix-turn-helix transcriptional regulator [Bacillaceae]MBO0961489.1 helix-turn-helix transcriptional regulator [Neobacillus sp. MM2021_6]NHC19593.1 helix-turn-helix transcriptional regulator [Bacillus sp. MM2020_4]
MKITLRAARVNAGLKLTDAAALLGINKDTLSKYEKDSTNVPRTFLINVEKLYQIPLDNIFFGPQSEFFRKFKTA